MRKYVYAAVAIILILASAFFVYQGSQLRKYKTLYERELQNVEAYQLNNSGLEGKIREYQMTMDGLRASKDSIDVKLANMVDELKIKDKKIEYLQYQVKQAHRTDTIQLSDTILVPEAKVDTLLGDKWYTLRLQLNYPSTIIASPTFTSEQYVVINSKREYNKKPSKWFFIRWFQKKHWVTEVDVIERSPYISVKQQKYIKVVK